MHPYYFGDSARQLYAVYDPPRAHAGNDRGVLLCYPMGQEYMRCHWACRQLVGQLNRVGMHCMRFDYYGTGDSAGAMRDAGLEQWLLDAGTGLDELRDIAGISKISLVGLRLGAVIAATVPAAGHRIDKLVLWDPVVNGAAYINSLRKMQVALREKLKVLHGVRAEEGEEGTEELLGYRYGKEMIAAVEEVDLLNVDRFSAGQIYLVVSEPQPQYEQLKQHLESLGVLKGYQVVSNPGEWTNVREIESALIAGELIGAVAADLSGKGK